MQGWLFLDGKWLKNENAKALLTAVEPGKILLLDLFSEAIPIYPKVESYFGSPWIWNMLHNFGGKTQMRGSFNSSNKVVFCSRITIRIKSYKCTNYLQEMTAGLTYPNSTMYGTGLTMEGIYQNYIIYQFTIDRSWSQKELDPIEWCAT